MNEPQTPLNPENGTFTYAWLCKLYFASGSEGCKVMYSPKNGSCKFRSLYYHDQKRLDYVALEKVLPERFLVPNSWFATTWQGGHVGGQNKRIFPRRIYMKIEFSSQRREMLLFLTTNMAAVTSRANQQWVTVHINVQHWFIYFMVCIGMQS